MRQRVGAATGVGCLGLPHNPASVRRTPGDLPAAVTALTVWPACDPAAGWGGGGSPGVRTRRAARVPPVWARAPRRVLGVAHGPFRGSRGAVLGAPRLRLPEPGHLRPAPPPQPLPARPSSPGSSRKPPSQAATLRAQAMAPRRPRSRRRPSGTSVGRPGHSPPAPSARSPPGPGPPSWPQANEGAQTPVLGDSVVPPKSPSPAFILFLSPLEFLFPRWVDVEKMSFREVYTGPEFEAILSLQLR